MGGPATIFRQPSRPPRDDDDDAEDDDDNDDEEEEEGKSVDDHEHGTIRTPKKTRKKKEN